MPKSIARNEIQRRCVAPIERLKARGVKYVTSDDIVKEMLVADPRLFKNWIPGKIVARDGISKSIGDALGNGVGGLGLPYFNNPKQFELDKIDIIDGILTRI